MTFMVGRLKITLDKSSFIGYVNGVKCVTANSKKGLVENMELYLKKYQLVRWQDMEDYKKCVYQFLNS